MLKFSSRSLPVDNRPRWLGTQKVPAARAEPCAVISVSLQRHSTSFAPIPILVRLRKAVLRKSVVSRVQTPFTSSVVVKARRCFFCRQACGGGRKG